MSDEPRFKFLFDVVADVTHGTRAARLRTAEEHLCAARDLVRSAGAPKTLARVRLAISSIKGAIRHAEHDEIRAQRNPKGQPS